MLKFDEHGRFRIMQIADVQELPKVCPDTLKLMNAALDRERPDLVVFTGDQLQGYDRSMRKGDPPTIAETVIRTILQPVTDRKIPFTVTYGNHDRDSGVPNAMQAPMYEKLSGCVLGTPRTEKDRGTFSLQIYDCFGDKPVFNIYLIDSGGLTKEGYDPVFPEQTDWYRAERERLKNAYGTYLPSLVFQHIPPPEVFCGLERVKKGDGGAVLAFRSHAHQYYRLPAEARVPGAFFREAPAPPDKNLGEFDALAEKGDVLGVFFGHDHMNSFVVRYKGVALGYTQGTGFNVYGPGGDRGVRVIELSADDPHGFLTHTLTYNALTDGIFTHPFKEFCNAHAPMGLVKWTYSRLLGCFVKEYPEE